MNVLYFIAYPQRMAGANRSLLDTLLGLAGECRPLVVVAGEGPVVEAYRKAGVEVLVMPPPGALNVYGKALARGNPLRLAGALRDLAAYTARLRALMRERRVDLVHVNNMRAGLLAGPAARLHGVPLVGHVRGELTVGKSFAAAYELICDRLVCVSDEVRKTLGRVGRRKARTIYNGIDASVMRPRQASFPWIERQRARGVVVFAYFASVVPFKAHALLLEAMARLNRDGMSHRYLVLCLGDFVPEYAQYHGWLAAHQNELRVDNATFAGWQADPFAFYDLADACLLISANHGTVRLAGQALALRGNEGFPRTILEAMLFGKPVIGTDNAGVREQVRDRHNGRLIPPLDPEALAGAMRELIEDEPARRRYGEAGARRVREEFSSQANRAQVLALYRELVTA